MRILKTDLTTVFDHGFDASTVSIRTIVSTASEPVSAIPRAIGALRGELPSGPPDLVLEML